MYGNEERLKETESEEVQVGSLEVVSGAVECLGGHHCLLAKCNATVLLWMKC